MSDDRIGGTVALNPEERSWAWQRVHGVSPAEGDQLADQLPTVDPRKVHYAKMMLGEWRAGRPPEGPSDWAIAYRGDELS